MHLGKLYSRFDSRCQSYFRRIETIINSKSSLPEWQFNYLSEVLVSDIWQSWCGFSRELFFSSCRGTFARNGNRIAARVGDNSWQRLGYEATQAAQQQNAKPSGHLNFAIRKEPTWGDIDVFIRIVNAIRPSNYNTLITFYGSFTDLKHIQKVRNACAHKNVETIINVSSLSTLYHFRKLNNPTEVIWKSKAGQREFALELWLYEMNLIADYVTSNA